MGGFLSLRTIGIILLVILGALGCKKKSDATPTPTPTPTSTDTPVGVVNDAAGFFIKPYFEDGATTYSYYFHEQSSLTASCSVAQGETDPAKYNIYCIMDAAELDLFFNGVSLNFNAPTTMCKYVRFTPYAYWKFEPAPVGYSSVLYINQDANGENIGSGNLNSADTGTSIDLAGAISCKYDYSAVNGRPNCCQGTAKVYTYKAPNVAPAPNNPPPAPGTFDSVADQQLSGNRNNCISGPAMQSEIKKSTEGFPLSTIYRTYGIGINDKFKVEAPISKEFGTNVYVSNYFLPSTFGNVGATFPPSASLYPTANSIYPYYEFGCLDIANDYVARIRVLIRSWDKLSEFNTPSTGNPYNDPALEPVFGTPYHDRSVWNKIGAAYPEE